MKYVYLLVVFIILMIQFRKHFRVKFLIEKGGEAVSRYVHKSAMGGIYVAIMLQVILHFSNSSSKKISVFLWLLPLYIVLFIAYYQNSKKIILYQTGILVFGDFILWENISKVALKEKELEIITNGQDPHYYTISKLKNGIQCYSEILSFTPDLEDYSIEFSEAIEHTIDDFFQ